ncbi:CbiX/SirB N-terminal domain-containing protein [Streptomyces sp. V4-01]|uniref:CbiX/SirB N-terminal domain-containing protein n=1 Tax=Actinacidiphila polyblastidii TaxID=3110430 RepID=A0ABU7PGH1_9ACTN|nr:CbiX/SirB N-terminal domain-containing protein [Streptomyces sp. V4-01]
MSNATGPAAGLPVRSPRPRQTGRHRRPEALTAPEGAPVLVLAVPGTPTAAALSLAEEVVSLARSELSGLDPRVAFVDGDGVDFPSLRGVLDQVAAERPGEDTSAVVVPLLAGPEASVLRRIRQAVADSKAQVELTEVLGPHPLLAEALHVRLSEAGLARADRARLFTVATAADGIILATVGGEEAAQAAGVTGLLLAARLAVPVLAAALDEEGAIGRAAEQLRSSGSGTLALAPCLIGPEIAPQLLHTAAAEAGCSGADALGPYPAVGKLVVTHYAAAVGIAPQSAQGAPQ